MATDAKPLTKPEWVDELHEPSWYREMAPKVDILVNAAPAIPETVKMFDEKVFRSMKKSAYFISISRGPNVDQVALARALREGWITGACLEHHGSGASPHFRTVGLPQPGHDVPHRGVRASAPHPPDGPHGRERPALYQWIAAVQRSRQEARLLNPFLKPGCVRLQDGGRTSFAACHEPAAPGNPRRPQCLSLLPTFR